MFSSLALNIFFIDFIDIKEVKMSSFRSSAKSVALNIKFDANPLYMTTRN